MNHLAEALELWVELTGVNPNSNKFRFQNDWTVDRMNGELKSSLLLDPSQVTTFMLFNVFAKEYFEEKSFSVNSLISNFDEVQSYITKVKKLYRILETPELASLYTDFQESILQAVRHYKADNEKVLRLVNDKNNLFLLRKDALHSIQRLRTFQFTQGTMSDETPKYVNKIYHFWNINSLVKSLMAYKGSMISLNIISEAGSSYPYFAFGIKNGGTISIVTDKPKSLHPLEEKLARNPGKDFAQRIGSHYFPYDLLNVSFTQRGYAYIPENSSSLVMYQKDNHPLKDMKDLSAEQVVWMIMMFDLIQQKFFIEKHQTTELGYTNEMVIVKDLTKSEKNELMITNYKPLETKPLTKDDISGRKLENEWSRTPTYENEWIEKRYNKFIPEEALNIIGTDNPQILLPSGKTTDVTVLDTGKLSVGKLASLSATDFGTSEEVLADQKWVARYNQALLINEELQKEYKETVYDVREWLMNKIQDNADNLLKAVANGSFIAPSCEYKSFGRANEFVDKNILDIMATDDENNYYTRFGAFWLSQGKDTETTCYLTGAKYSLKGVFKPTTSEALAKICNCNVSDLPEVLQNWTTEELYYGNDLLERIDPMDWAIDNPWRKENFDVVIYLSKNAYNKLRKTEGLEPNKFWNK